jgi:uncharacterized repeat protein (TIGR03803 family)
LYYFSGPQCLVNCKNSDGVFPNGLIQSSNILYGTTRSSGPLGGGTVFALSSDGTGFAALHAFGSAEGGPNALVLSGSTLYGTVVNGPLGGGAVFAVNTDGTGFRLLHDFAPGAYATNNGGTGPSGLVSWGTILYGATVSGGAFGSGTVFALNIDGTGFTTLYNFTAETRDSDTNSITWGQYTNSDGAKPYGLVVSGGRLYGATMEGGSGGSGTIFSLKLPVPPPRLSLISDGSGGYFIRAQGQPNFTCQLQRAPSLAGPWTSSAPQTGSNTGFMEFHDLFPPPVQAFYRTVQQ